MYKINITIPPFRIQNDTTVIDSDPTSCEIFPTKEIKLFDYQN